MDQSVVVVNLNLSLLQSKICTLSTETDLYLKFSKNIYLYTIVSLFEVISYTYDIINLTFRSKLWRSCHVNVVVFVNIWINNWFFHLLVPLHLNLNDFFKYFLTLINYQQNGRSFIRQPIHCRITCKLMTTFRKNKVIANFKGIQIYLT